MKKLFIGLFISSSLAAYACGPNSDLCNDEVIIGVNGLKGRVVGAPLNGEVVVRFDGYTRTNLWPVDQLARIFGCSEDKKMCVGNKIIADGGLPGIVAGILINNEVMVKFKRSEEETVYRKWPTIRLAPMQGCTPDNFCVGNKVIADKKLSGVVAAISFDGDVMVKFQTNEKEIVYKKWPTDRLDLVIEE